MARFDIPRLSRYVTLLISIFSFSALLPSLSFAQAPAPNQGLWPFASVNGGQYDTVNLATLGIQVRATFRSKQGSPSLPFSFAAGTSDFVGGGQGGYPKSNLGSPDLLGFYLTPISHVVKCSYVNPDTGLPVYGQYTEFTDFYETDVFGNSHSFPIIINTNCNVIPIQGSPHSASAYAADGSGYFLVVTITPTDEYGAWSLTRTLYDPSGRSSGGISETDPDGNSEEVSYTGVTGFTYTDSLGLTALTGTTPSLTTSPYTWNLTWNNAAGGQSQASITFTSLSIGNGNPTVTCGQITNTANENATVITGMTFADGSSLSIGWEETAGTNASGGPCYTGQIASLSLPTGGVITYVYTGTNNVDGTPNTMTRTSPAGTWTYVHTYISGSVPTTTAVTDPAGNETDYTFVGRGYETLRKVYQGSAASGTLLETVQTCYNGNFTNCTTTATAPTLPFSQTDVYTSFNTSSSSLVETKFDSYSNPLEVKKYDYGAAMPPTGNPLSDTLIYYGQSWNGTACTAYPSGIYIVNTPCYSYTKNSVGTTVAQTHITYSNTGHPTSTAKLTSGSSLLTSTAAYNTNGTVATATDVNGALYKYGYNGMDGCNSLLPTSVVITGTGLPSAGLTSSTEWNCNGAVPIQTLDPNGQPTSYAYNDLLSRMTSMTDPMSNVTNYYYTTPTTFESAMNFGTTSTSDKLYTADGLGRLIETQTRTAQGADYFDSAVVDTYGWTSTGATSTQTIPGGAVGTKTQSDAIGRPLTVTDGGGGTVSYIYVQNDVLQTVGPGNPPEKQLQYNGLGQLTSVCETLGAPGSGACGQTNPEGGDLTLYTYDPLGNLLTVTQNAQGTPQTRTYQFDGLSRLVSETNPETGTISYVYDTDSTCGTYKGDLVKKVDAAGNVICYGHDGLHRVTSITHPSGTYASVTPDAYFVYDAATVDGVAMTNTPGLNAEAYTVANRAGASGTKLTDEGFSYDTDSRLTGVYQSTPNSGGYYATTASYWANGTVNTLGGVPGLSGWTFLPDGEGRPFSATYNTSTPMDWVTSTLYYPSNPNSTTVMYGDSDTDVYTFDATTGRMNQFQFTVKGTTTQTLTGTLGWNANWTLANLGITDQFTPANTQFCSYAYDNLARINNVSCLNSSNTTIWNQSFTLDAFGNLSKSGTTTFAASYLLANGTTNNREQSVASCMPTYDANGNLTKDCVNSDLYAWNADGRPTTLDGEPITFDAFGREVEFAPASGSTHTQILYSPIGKLGTMNGQTAVTIRVPLPGGSTAELLGATAGTRHILHSDWLGSARLSTNYTGQTVANDTAYAPYGEEYPVSSTDLNFTGQSQDTLPGLYDFQYREYSPVQGRWISPDPAGLGAVDPTNPQSWNRYAYVLNNPLSAIDPLGLDCATITGADGGDRVSSVQSVTVGPGDCPGNDPNNEFYFDGHVTDTAIDPNGNVVATVDGKLTCSGDSNCAAWNNVASVTVNGGYTPVTLLPSLSAMTGTSTWIPGAATISRGPTQPPPLKPGCTEPALVAGAKAAGSDFAGGPPGANPGSDVADLATSKNVQRAAVGTLYVAANSAKSLAPAFDLAADAIPYVGEVVLTAQGYQAAKAGIVAYKNSVDQCYGQP